MDMKRLFVAMVSLFAVCSVYPQTGKTFNELKKEFRKQKVFALDVDLSKTQYSGLSFDDFKEYVAEKNGTKSILVKVALNKYKSSFYMPSKYYKFVNDSTNTIPYRIHLNVESINENAGIVAKAIVSYKDSVDIASIDLSVKDGRWNTFDVLMEENAQKQLKLLIGTLKVSSYAYADYYNSDNIKTRRIIYLKDK